MRMLSLVTHFGAFQTVKQTAPPEVNSDASGQERAEPSAAVHSGKGTMAPLLSLYVDRYAALPSIGTEGMSPSSLTVQLLGQGAGANTRIREGYPHHSVGFSLGHRSSLLRRRAIHIVRAITATKITPTIWTQSIYRLPALKLNA